MASTYELLLKIGGAIDSSFGKSTSNVTKSLSLMGKATKPVTSGLSSIGSKLFGIAGGVVAGITLDTVAEEASAVSKTMAQMGAVLKSTGDASGMSQNQLEALADAQAKVTTYSKNTTEQAENMMLTFTGIGSKTFPTAIKAAEDYATATGGSATSAAQLLGKALNDPATGLSKLTRVGITFTAAQQKQIKAMEKTGNTAGAQGIMLSTFSKKFGGSAQAIGNTLSGQISKAKNSLMEAAMTAFSAIMPVVTKLLPSVVKGVQQISEFIQTHQKDIQGVTQKVGALAQSIISGIVPIVTNLFGFVIKSAQQISKFIQAHQKQIQTVAKEVGALAQKIISGIMPIVTGIFGFVAEHGKLVMGVIIGVASAFAILKGVTLAASAAEEIHNALIVIGAIKSGALAASTGALTAAKATELGITGDTTLAQLAFNVSTIASATAHGIATAATAVGTAAQWAFNAAMNAGLWPVLAIVAGIALLAVGAYELIKHWKQVSAFFAGLWSDIVGAFKTAISAVTGFFKQWGPLILTFIAPVIGIPLLIIQHFGQIKTFFAGLWSDITGGFKGFINLIIDGINGLIGGLDKFSIKMPSWMPLVGGKTIGFSIPKIPQLANGGIISHRPGGILANIGEGNYDEAVVPLKGGNSAGSNGSPTFVYSPQITIQGNASKDDVQQVIDNDKAQFAKQMKQWLSENARRSPSGKVSFA
jgi:hypothetical protein